MPEMDKIDKTKKTDPQIDNEYKKRMCKKREKTTLEKLDIIKKTLTEKEKPNHLTKSLKLLEIFIADMKKKKETRNSKRNKYDGL